MGLRHITKEDLPKLAELISCEELAAREDISFDHSAVAIDDNGVIVAFVIMRQRSLQDFFGGRIPDERRRRPQGVRTMFRLPGRNQTLSEFRLKKRSRRLMIFTVTARRYE